MELLLLLIIINYYFANYYILLDALYIGKQLSNMAHLVHFIILYNLFCK